MLYILSIVYVIRDAQRRGAEPWWMWAIISVIPIVGLLAYVILRPSSYLIDREEQDLDIALREHQLSHYGICPKCGAPIDRDFVVCPICNTQVRNVCPTCHRPLNADWKVCPYCRTPHPAVARTLNLLFEGPATHGPLSFCVTFEVWVRRRDERGLRAHKSPVEHQA